MPAVCFGFGDFCGISGKSFCHEMRDLPGSFYLVGMAVLGNAAFFLSGRQRGWVITISWSRAGSWRPAGVRLFDSSDSSTMSGGRGGWEQPAFVLVFIFGPFCINFPLPSLFFQAVQSGPVMDPVQWPNDFHFPPVLRGSLAGSCLRGWSATSDLYAT